jgi:hypothetical protein
VIEKPLPLSVPTNGTGRLLVREDKESYGGGKPLSNLGSTESLDARSRVLYQENDKRSSDHVISGVVTGETTQEYASRDLLLRERSDPLQPPLL